MTKEGGEARDKLEKIQLKQKADDAHAEILMNRAHDIAEECKAFYKDAGLGAVKLPEPPIPVPEDWGKGVSADAAGGEGGGVGIDGNEWSCRVPGGGGAGVDKLLRTRHNTSIGKH
jgi:hypothetical protein